MALTRANAESILVVRCGPLMAAADMSIVTDGSNADLNDPIGRAVRHLGYTVTDITDVADADVAQVATSEYDEFLDVGEYYTLQSILGNYDAVDITVGPRSERLSQLVRQIERLLDRKSEALRNRYGLGLSNLTGGVITLDFAEHVDA